MAQRAIFPEGVEIHQPDLGFERDTRIFEHLQLFLDGAASGVQSGLAVTPNGGDATKVDIASGTAYSPNGSYCVLAIPQSAIPLADGTLGVVNLVGLVYTETQSNPQPHETGSSSPNTRANRSTRVRVLTQAQYDALPQTDANLSNDDRDRFCVVARVVATGGGLSTSDITLPTVFRTVNEASALINITGVSITGIADSTSEGTGTLTFTLAGTLLSWQAPGEAVGADVAVGAGGFFTLISGGGSTLQVFVITASLPGGNQTDSVVITNIYSQIVARMSYEDWLHRSKLGTGVPSDTNPHGLTVNDIGGVGLAELEAHMDLQHSNGIWRGSAANALLCSIDETAVPDRLLVVAPAGGDTYYVNGTRLSTIVNSTVLFTGAPVNAVLYEIIVDNAGNVTASARATWPSPRTITGVEIIDVSDNTGAGARTLSFVFATTILSWDGGTTQNVSAGGRFRLMSSDEQSVIEVHVLTALLPLVNQSDSITVNALADTDAYLRLGMVAWHGSADGFLGYGPPTLDAQMLDKRLFGTLTNADRQDEVVLTRTRPIIPGESAPNNVVQVTQRLLPEERALDELRATGVVVGFDRAEIRSLAVTAGAGLTVVVEGGACYVHGERFDVAPSASLAVPNNTTSHVYVDATGALRVADTATAAFSVLVGTQSIEVPGAGAVLARVVTSGGAVTDVQDFRRNVTRIDGKDAYSVASSDGREIAQFFSLQAAIAYAQQAGISEVRIVGAFAETIVTPISITTPLRVVCEPFANPTFSGTATHLFAVGANGMLEILGGIWTFSSALDFIRYGGNAASHVIVSDISLSMNGAGVVFKNSTDDASSRGVLFRNCAFGSGTGAFIRFEAGWAGPGPIVIQKCRINRASATFILDALGGADTIAKVSVIDSEVVCTDGIVMTANSTLDDCRVSGTKFTPSAQAFDIAGTTNRLMVRGCTFDGALGAFVFSPGSTKSHTDMLVSDCLFLNGATNPYYDSRTNSRPIRLTISNCHFSAPGTALAAISIAPGAGVIPTDIEIIGCEIDSGQIALGGLGRKDKVSIRGNILNKQANIANLGAIDLQACEQFVVEGNIIFDGGGAAGGVRGILTDSSCNAGVISNNRVLMSTAAGNNDGISNNGFEVDIIGNNVRISGAGPNNRDAIRNTGDDVTISGNVIVTEETDTSGNGILNSGSHVAIVGNMLRATSANYASDMISSSGDDCVINSNVVRINTAAPPAGAARSIVSSGASVVVSGNKVTNQAGGGNDIDCTGADTIVIGNVTSNAGGAGGVIVNSGGGSLTPAGTNV